MSILAQIGKGFRVAGRGLFAAPEGRMVSPLVRGGLEYGAYSGGALAIDEYAKSNFEHEGSKNVASAAAFLLKAKGVHSLALGGTRSIGELGARIGQRYKGETGQKVAGLLTTLRGAGKNLYYSAGKASPVGRLTPGSVAWHKTPEALRNRLVPMGKPFTTVSTFTHNRAAGAVDKFISDLNPLTLPFRGVMWAAKGAISFPGKAVSGAVEYGKVYGNALRATKAHGGGAGWGTMALGLAEVKHPLAPMIAGGLVLGGAKSFAERYQYGSNGWTQSQYSAPLTSSDTFEGPVGGSGSVDPTNFPGGMTMGRGRSAIRSQTVMEGQSAVTSKMLAHRRV